MKAKLFIAVGALAAIGWAASNVGAAHFLGRSDAPLNRTATPPQSASFQVEKGRGLIVRVWINGAGPYFFALDTGAGMNLISQRLVTEKRLATKAAPATLVGGLSPASRTANREAIIENLGIGARNNVLPSRQTALIVSNLPADIDGIIDPTEAYAPFGYSIDMPKARIAAIDSIDSNQRVGGSERALVSWIHKPRDNRPFVKLGDGRIALIDTGSGFGLAVNDRNAVIVGGDGSNNQVTTSDLGGGVVRSRRVQPTTISIGDLVLRRIPTDILFGAHKDAPTILGRDALYPFKVSFDPKRRLIEFEASTADD